MKKYREKNDQVKPKKRKTSQEKEVKKNCSGCGGSGWDGIDPCSFCWEQEWSRITSN